MWVIVFKNFCKIALSFFFLFLRFGSFIASIGRVRPFVSRSSMHCALMFAGITPHPYSSVANHGLTLPTFGSRSLPFRFWFLSGGFTLAIFALFLWIIRWVVTFSWTIRWFVTFLSTSPAGTFALCHVSREFVDFGGEFLKKEGSWSSLCTFLGVDCHPEARFK